jgi:two-component system sensor histidine kinase BaeS
VKEVTNEEDEDECCHRGYQEKVVAEQVVVAQRPRAEAAGLELLFEPGEDLTPVWGECNRLTQVVTNLVANAINYAPAGRVRVTTRLDRAHGQACLQVEDTGMGIEPEDLPYLFDRFYRGLRASQSEVPGTGLGLAIAKEIVGLHGGEIEVESRVREGSTLSERGRG